MSEDFSVCTSQGIQESSSEKPFIAMRMLSGALCVFLTIPSTIAGLIGITMIFYIMGFATSTTSTYVAGAACVFLYLAFIWTPIFALLHLISATGAISKRFSPILWSVTVGHAAVCWTAVYFVSRDAYTPADSDGDSWVPLLLFGVAPTSVSIFGFIISLLETRKEIRIA